jgi:hypothetical protein
MNLLKFSISTFFAAATVISGSLIVVQPAIAKPSGSTMAPSSSDISNASKTTADNSPNALIVNRAITVSEILDAQRAWGDALVNISTTYETKGRQAAKDLAAKIIDAAYGYQFGAVLFKPTLALPPLEFRTTRAGALAYFVGGSDDPKFSKDDGFALKGWRKVEVKNEAIFISGDTATTMGTVTFTNNKPNATPTVVDKTWQFFKGDDGKLRIIVHHSSVLYKEDAPGKSAK